MFSDGTRETREVNKPGHVCFVKKYGGLLGRFGLDLLNHLGLGSTIEYAVKRAEWFGCLMVVLHEKSNIGYWR